MKTFSPSSTAVSSSLQPLNLDDLRAIIGGDGDVINPDDLLGTNGVIVEDTYEL